MKTEALLVCLLARFMLWLTLFEDKYISLLDISRGCCVLLYDTRDTDYSLPTGTQACGHRGIQNDRVWPNTHWPVTETGLQHRELEKAPEREDIIYSIYGHTLEQGSHLTESSVACQDKDFVELFCKTRAERSLLWRRPHLIKHASCFLPQFFLY